MDFKNRSNYLRMLFSYDRIIDLDDRKVKILPFTFNEKSKKKETDKLLKLVPYGSDFCRETDNLIKENVSFNYPVFVPDHDRKYKDCIILLHGLNERNWNKYLCWAEYLCKSTGKPVILFPIAFHMNRTPENWYLPRQSMPWVSFRKNNTPDTDNSTFANVALSLRLSSNPMRLYTSGRETILNLWQLVKDIKRGNHKLFQKDTECDFFAYSIGAMIAQVMFISNPEELLSDSKFFLFCGGSIFENMNGSAKEIMDKAAWMKVYSYFSTKFGKEDGFNNKILPDLDRELLNKSFSMMINNNLYAERRHQFFNENKNRISIYTLKKDVVIPTHGVKLALGENARNILKELDFEFNYTHQNPFPIENTDIDPSVLNNAFLSVFNPAASFLS